MCVGNGGDNRKMKRMIMIMIMIYDDKCEEKEEVHNSTLPTKYSKLFLNNIRLEVCV